MDINEVNAELKVRRQVELKPPAPSYSEIKAAPEPAPHWYRFLLPAIGTIIILVSGGRALFDRLIVPKSTVVAPTQTPAIPVQITNPKVAKIQDSSIYPVTWQSPQSIGIKTQLAGQISKILVKPGDRVKAGQILLQLAAPGQRTRRVVNRPIPAAPAPSPAAPTIKNETTPANTSEANTRLRSLDARKVAVQADIQLKLQEYQRFEQLATAGAASQQNVTQKLDKLLAAETTLKEIEASIQAEKSKIETARSSIVPARPAVKAVKITKVDPPVDPTPVKTQQYTIAAPFSGIVGDISAKNGAVVTKQTQLLTIAPTDRRLDVKLQIPADRASSVRNGFPVQLIDERERLLQTGQISAISPTVDPVKRSIPATATFPNPQTLNPTGLVRARFIWKENPTIVLPTTAISQLTGQSFVFVAVARKDSNCPIEGKGQNIPADELVAAQRPIQLGKPIGTDRSVLSGLNASDRIITSELPRLKNCAPIVDRAQPPQAPNKTGG